MVDSVELVGRAAGYPGPRVLAVRVVRLDPRSASPCGVGVYPFRASGRRITLLGVPAPPGVADPCALPDLGPLSGYHVPADRGASGRGPREALAEVRAPPAHGCWALTAVEVHYHVGFRHYTATNGDDFAACSPGTPSQLDAAAAAVAAVSG